MGVFCSTTIKATEKRWGEECALEMQTCSVMYLEIINDSDVYRKQSLASWSVANYGYTYVQPSLIIVLYYKVWILSCMN